MGVVCNSSPGNYCTGVVCSSPCDYSSSCVLRSSHCHCSSSVLCSCSCDHGSSCVLCSSHCHCSSSVLCSRSREHGSSCVIRGCSCIIRILWCASVRRACNQHRALIRVQCVHAFIALVASASDSLISFLFKPKAASIMCCSVASFHEILSHSVYD